MVTRDFSPSNYPASLAALIPNKATMPLGAGTPDREMRSALQAIDPQKLFRPHELVNRDMGQACLSGLWLAHNFLDESHSISQDLKNPTGSFWHGIMHRREGDFSNAKYWFRLAGKHPVLNILATDVEPIMGELPADRATLTEAAGHFDPFVFVDWCSAAIRGEQPQQESLERLSRREWERLFDWCYQQAVGDTADI